MDRIPVLNMKEVDPLTENLSFVIGLDPKAQFCVQPTQPLLQLAEDSFVHCQAAASARICGAFKTMAWYKMRGVCGIKIPCRTVCETVGRSNDCIQSGFP